MIVIIGVNGALCTRTPNSCCCLMKVRNGNNCTDKDPASGNVQQFSTPLEVHWNSASSYVYNFDYPSKIFLSYEILNLDSGWPLWRFRVIIFYPDYVLLSSSLLLYKPSNNIFSFYQTEITQHKSIFFWF